MKVSVVLFMFVIYNCFNVGSEVFVMKFVFAQSISNQCSISIPPENVFRGYRDGKFAGNGIMKCMFSREFFVSSKV